MKEIARHPDCAPGTWWWTKGEAGPTVSCPQCQALHMIPVIVRKGEPEHTISSGGVVTPSVICGRCGWHDTIRLLGWTGEPCRRDEHRNETK